MENKTGNKKELLNVNLSHIENETPDTLRIVEHARLGISAAKATATAENTAKAETAATAENTAEADTTAKTETPAAPSMVTLGTVANIDNDTDNYTDVPAAAAGTAVGSAAGAEAVITAVPDDDYMDGSTNKKGRLFDRFIRSLSGIIPGRGDPPLEIIRKCVFIVALITLIISLAYIINDMVIIPLMNQQEYKNVDNLYDPDNPAQPPADFPASKYPKGISDAFKALYAQNQDIRGWLKYTDNNNKWLNINYPVMFSGDNDYYLSHDFQKAKNKNGALFFDKRTNLESYEATNKVLIIYGHNMASGQMFSPLNKLLSNLNYMRSAPVISMDTLYKRGEYEIFSVMLLSTREEDGPYFDYLRTSFNGDQDFMDFVTNIKARSIYDFNAVDIQPTDQLLVLSTCTALSNAHFKDGRCVIVARRVRDGESVAVRSTDIVKNDDAIMPYAWYTNQKMTPHKFYTDPNYKIPGITVSTPTGTYTYSTIPTTYYDNPGGYTTRHNVNPTVNGTTKPAGTTKPNGSTNHGTTTSVPGGTTLSSNSTHSSAASTSAGTTKETAASSSTDTTAKETEATESSATPAG